MKIRAPKSTWTILAAAAAIVVGAPAWADDTELLLVNPNLTAQPEPNILFILDTSGSMTTEEQTIEPYDSAVVYPGDCDINKLYWTDINILPVCDPTGNDAQVIEKTSFVCESASKQIAGIGSYTDTMIQRRPYDYFYGEQRTALVWLDLEPFNETDLVECESDRGQHGDGSDEDAVFPSKWIYVGDYDGVPWEEDEDDELAWGSAPRNKEYSVYDGNYLNWKNSPLAVSLTRNAILETVIKTVLNSVDDVNVGVMRFNNRDGGPVIKAVQSLNDNRASILQTIDDLTAAGRTPLSETLYEAALYWNGFPAYYGEKINEHTTDPDALTSLSPEVYKTPILDACAKNYNVLLTDGEPVSDDETPNLVSALPNWTATTGEVTCAGNANGGCLDEVAQYMALRDSDPLTAGLQTVATHTIGFAIDLPILAETANKSGGNYFLADDVESLTLALLKIVNDITERSLSFSAPAVSVNSFNRTQNLNDLYMTMFGAKAKVHWPGNLKKYKLTGTGITDANGLSAVDPNTGFFYNSARSFWTTGPENDGNDVLKGGAASMLPDPTVRRLFTNAGGSSATLLTAPGNALTPSNSNAFANADFGLTGADGEPSKDELIRWMRGEDIRDEDKNPSTTVRNAMGDPLHSQPAAVAYGGTIANPDIVVYSSTNDGYLHAFDATTGIELWSFVPHELLRNMNRLFFDPDSKFKNYGLDGNIVPVIYDQNNDGVIDSGTDFIYLLVGMRRGGNSLYALDVTNKDAPELMWISNEPGTGQSWSTPVVARVDAPGISGANSQKAVVVMGGGYDTVHDSPSHPTQNDAQGAAVLMLDLVTGNELWRATTDAGASGLSIPKMNRSIASQVKVVDMSGDGLADRMYAADMGGQVLRFDIYNGETNLANFVTGGVIAQLGAEGMGAVPTPADTRRFFSSPDVSIFSDDLQDKKYIAISIGSGYRAGPLSNASTDRFFSVRDPDVFNRLTQAEYDGYSLVTNANLLEVRGQKEVVITDSDRGWMYTLPDTQKVFVDSITFENQIFFVAFSPDTQSNNACSVGAGANYLYRMNVVNGDPVVNNLDSLTAAEAEAARSNLLAQGGIAPTPTILFPSSDDPNCEGMACAPPPVMCIGAECSTPFDPQPPNRTLWTQDGVE